MNHGNDENQTQNPLIPGQKHNSFRYKYQYGQKSFGFSSENQGFLSSLNTIGKISMFTHLKKTEIHRLF